MRSVVSPLLVVAAYLAGMNLFFLPAQARVMHGLTAVDVLVMVALIGPFVALRWRSPFPLRATRIAWASARSCLSRSSSSPS